MKKRFLFILLLSLSFFVKGQYLYDPSVKDDGMGELYYYDQLNTLELEFYDPNYHQTLIYYKENFLDSRLPAKLDYGSFHFDSVGIRYKGNSTFAIGNLFNTEKMPMNIDINYYISGQKVERYKKMKLANAIIDPTFAKEVLASHIYRQYLPTYQANLLRVEVNGNYLGVYVNQESIDDQFLKKHFGEKDGIFFKCDPLSEEEAGHPVPWSDLSYLGPDSSSYLEIYDLKSSYGWSDLVEFIDQLNNNPSALPNLINIDRVLWFFACNNVLLNEDAYNTSIVHNYYLYKTADGKFQIIPWDLSETFAGILFTEGTPQSHYEYSPLNGLSPYLADRPLVYQLLSDDYYKKKYVAHLRTILEENFTASVLKSWIMDLQGMAYDEINADPNKPFTIYQLAENVDTPINWLVIYTIAGVTDIVTNRRNYLLAHPELMKIPPTISNLNQSILNPSSSETVIISAEVTNATEVRLMISTNDAPFASDFIALSMQDNGLNGDQLAGDNIYSVEVPYNSTNTHVKYYIEAENIEALSTLPKRAEYQYYHYYVDQVVHVEDNTINYEIYPNPAADYLFLKGELTGIIAIDIYSINGQKMRQVSKEDFSLIYVGDLPRGSYLLNIQTSEGMISKKLLLN